jgi:outer membrane protein assembly factor BamB
MTDSVSPTPLEPTCDFAAEAAAAELVRILDFYIADLQAGKAPSKAELLARHPQQAAQLEACLAGLEFIHGTETAGANAQQRLGDFRIIREVGRGGMGAVFEAEQVSLRRRVALKILRFGGVSDPDAIERFQREAETVAGLHHTNIVPIFAVGTERGVSYYAMQFIEGQSLAQVLAAAKQPLPADRVAQWGLQAAEALTHAHQRGVIHRDVKPSNLILDNDERLWLTDFGLARRLDDVTLSMTGAILGTPRYMSPEQAAASNKRVDHRTDLFSLGATLYELIAGSPAFQGDTPHKVIQHILASEPQPIREVVPGVPRDLETIVMKCLAKEPHERYAAAADVAADLRAFLEGRPIRARRAGPVELAARWLKSQQRSFRLAAAAAAVTLLITIGGLLGWSSYDAWQQATIKLDATVPPLVAEILDERDDVLRVETVPMQNAASLPAGDYRLRVSGNGTLSQTFDVSLGRGKEHAHTLDLHDQMLWFPREIERGFDLVDFGNEQALVSWNADGIGLHKRRSPFLQWSIKLEPARLPDPTTGPGLRWPWNDNQDRYSGYGNYDSGPWVAPQATDIDGDGVGDLLIAARHQAWLMAVSGNTGGVLWFAGRGQDVAETLQPARRDQEYVSSGVVGMPISHDCNADGTPDIIATLMDAGTKWPQTQNQIAAKCWVEAFSGKTGETLWTYELPAEWFEMPSGEGVPYDLRWFVGLEGGTMSHGGNSMNDGRHHWREPGQPERTGAHAYRPAAMDLITLAGKETLAIVAGTRLVTLDPASGKLGEPVDLSARPGRPCQWGNIDGDRSSELVFLEVIAGAGRGTATPRLHVWSLEHGKDLWSEKLDARWPQMANWSVPAPHWPLLADLNGDGKSEIVVPTEQGNLQGRFGGRVPWGMVSVLAGDSGQTLWKRRLVTMDSQIDHCLAGPDIDGDGQSELYVVAVEGVDHRVHVDALSGRSGATLWHSSQAPPPSSNSSRNLHLEPPQWWRAGEDGQPQLVVQLVNETPGSRASYIWTFSAANGRLERAGQGITAVRPIDVDADGVEDLLVYDSRIPTALDLGGKLHCIRGVAREKWQRLDSIGEPAADFDGDGIQDLTKNDFVAFTATSGATGRQLWVSHLEAFRPESRLHPAGGDLNGDGIQDLLGWSEATSYGPAYKKFFALSGKTGRTLWSAGEITAHRVSSGQVIADDLDGDGRLEVLWLSMIDHGYPDRNSFSSQEAQLWLFVVSGDTGKLRWSQPLSPPYGGQTPTGNQIVNDGILPPFCLGDADGDGVLDVLVPELLPNLLPDGSHMATRVLSGKDGKTLWSRPYPADPNQQQSLTHWIPPTAVDLDGDGRTEFVGLEVEVTSTPSRPQLATHRVVALEGQDGRERWTVSSDVRLGYWRPPTGISKAALLRPRVLRVGDRRRVAMILGNESKLMVLEPDGQKHELAVQRESLHSGVWACDKEEDGVDEVAFLTAGGVCFAAANQLDKPLWKRPLGNSGQQRILQIVAGPQGQPPIVVVVDDGTDNSVLGLSAADGHIVWSCPGPIPRDPRDGVFMVPQQIALLAAGETVPPHVYYAYGSVARCRQAFSEPEKVVLKPMAHDDRWERDLPWVDRQDRVSKMALTVGWSLLLSALLIVLPAGYLGSLVWKRRFTLQILLWLPVVAGLCLFAALVKPPFQIHNRLSTKLMMGLGLAPVVISCCLLVWWSVRGKWRRTAVWLAISVIVSVIAAMVVLYFANGENPMLPEESYDWSYWYLIWFVGGFLTSWLMIVFLPLQLATLAIWRRWKKPTPAMVNS